MRDIKCTCKQQDESSKDENGPQHTRTLTKPLMHQCHKSAVRARPPRGRTQGRQPAHLEVALHALSVDEQVCVHAVALQVAPVLGDANIVQQPGQLRANDSVNFSTPRCSRVCKHRLLSTRSVNRHTHPTKGQTQSRLNVKHISLHVTYCLKLVTGVSASRAFKQLASQTAGAGDSP